MRLLVAVILAVQMRLATGVFFSVAAENYPSRDLRGDGVDDDQNSAGRSQDKGQGEGREE